MVGYPRVTGCSSLREGSKGVRVCVCVGGCVCEGAFVNGGKRGNSSVYTPSNRGSTDNRGIPRLE